MQILSDVLIAISFVSVLGLCYLLIICKDCMRTYYSDDPSEYWKPFCEIHPNKEIYCRMYPCPMCKCTCGKCECHKKQSEETKLKSF